MTQATNLSKREMARYARHIAIPQVGLTGQERLTAARVLVVGAGGLGGPVLSYLAAAGIGTLGIVEFDTVSGSNLQRQVLFDDVDIGRPKLWRARARLQAQNPHIRIVGHEGPLDPANVEAQLTGYDIVVDGSDNFVTRYVLNDACRLAGIPLVHGSLHRFDGQLAVFHPDRAGCYRCLFPQPPAGSPDCSEAGVFGALAGTLGTLQATEVLKLVLGIGAPLSGRVLLYDALGQTMTTVILTPDPQCPLCGPHATIQRVADVDYRGFGEGPDEDDTLPAAWEMTACQARLTGLVIVDVRERLGTDGLLCGASHIPFSQFRARLAELPADQGVLLVCWSGSTSAQAVRLGRAGGPRRACCLCGGLRG
ncbi:MAG: molybdopterin-synthase adenylyltransferase MoeB, partial [Candidatus Sericytochromatia bacterium]|nr:molybdopterin-synthase adenylyltransferase MoeB [Candidatus Sericytochromatia bacterium]